MYFPYLRGRQFELIALRELVEKGVLSSRITPIIEPVKLSSTLVKTIEKYGVNGKQIAIVTNPKVGSFNSDAKEEKNQKLKESLSAILKENDNIIFMNLLKPNLKPEKFIERYADNMGTICNDKDAISVYEVYFAETDVKYNLIPDESGFRRKIRKNRVLLANKFNKLDRNNDYIEVDDEPFSEDHLYYQEDGYVGFADYSVVGEEYNETGFAPYAVAIHIVYFDKDNSLRIKHFVSDSNDDISDPAGKFQEALSKLVEWNEEKQLDTVAMGEFEDLYNREAYPGLGTVKKLSIMHHLELMGRYLDKE
ncbi:MAG: sce7725 family protein [Bacteroidales bacterium]|nr:sce7725 family protein [Bacteroidales bacterium]MCM1416057.1 sce7725 family protein [bacterium]MCM1424173.1 sce7725 family protein [bacterium]